MKASRVTKATTKKAVSKAIDEQEAKLRVTAGQGKVIASRTKPKATVK